MERTLPVGRFGEAQASRRRKAAQRQSKFSELTQTVANNRRNTRLELKAAQMARIISR